MKVILGNYLMVNDFYVFPMGGILHIVLGLEWLYSLGEFSSNYQTLELKFILHGKYIILHGIKENVTQDKQ